MAAPATLIRHITVDASDALHVARFWAAVLGWEVDDESDEEEALAAPPQGGTPGLLFVRVPEPKTGKNRLHLDLQPQDLTRDQEVDRLLGLGARLADDRREPDGTGWAVLADPEGNEFCVERSPAERGQGQPASPAPLRSDDPQRR